jgi:hypothetical protein
MPRKPRTPKRPTDVNQLAKRVVELATHQAEEEPSAGTSEAAMKRGAARAARLSPEKRKAIAKKAAKARWTRRDSAG